MLHRYWYLLIFVHIPPANVGDEGAQHSAWVVSGTSHHPECDQDVQGRRIRVAANALLYRQHLGSYATGFLFSPTSAYAVLW